MSESPTGHDFLMGAFRAAMADVERWLPSANRKALEWDLSQLERLALNRGLRYFTIDLPEFGKAFEQSLAQGSLVPQSVPGFHKLKTKRGTDARPRLLWALTSRVFKYNGSLRASACTTSIFLVRQLCYLAKKLKGDCRDAYKFDAVRDLFDVELGMSESTLDWDDPFSPYSSDGVWFGSPHPVSVQSGAGYGGRSDLDDHQRCERSADDYLQRVSNLVVGILPGFDPHCIRGRHGPGAVSDGTWRMSKYSFPSWPAKLECIFPFDWHGSTRLMTEEDHPGDAEVFSRLIAVPKTHKGPRLIASEPVCNQWIQQGMRDYFEDAFRTTFIGRSVRIHDQSLNQDRAKQASFGSLATLDLSAASDRLSCHVVERVFARRPDILSAMMACRTSHLRNDLDKKSPNFLKLKKFAMMGSALTFPVQSLVFYIFSMAAVCYSRGLRVDIRTLKALSDEVSVYGDDIIVPVDSAEALTTSLTRWGLKVNRSKSFAVGNFRESCGTDWYRGECVTPAYIRSDFDPKSPSSLATVVETSNNFHEKGLWSVADYLVSRIPRRLLSKLPVEDGSIALKGLRSFAGTSLSHLKRRYNQLLDRWEYRVVALSARLCAPRPEGVCRLRQYFTERPGPEYNWDPRVSGRSVPVLRERYAPLYGGV